VHLSAMRDISSLRDDLNRTTVEFLRTDLDTGIMLARIATGARKNSERRERNTRNARMAYDTVEKLRRQAPMSTEIRNALDEKIGLLRSLLEVLGESFA
jgi:hypothetical protein